MKANKTYVFVPREIYKPFFNRCYNVLVPLIAELKKIGIKATLYPIGSGKRHLVTQKIVNGKPQAYDLDFNLEIDLDSLPPKYKSLKKLKDKIRGLLNQIMANKDFFSDGQDSTSVISVPLHFNDSKEIEFSFDLAIVSRNSYGNLQRLIHDKSHNNYTWSPAKNSKDCDIKAERLKTPERWNKVRKRYLELKNQFINDNNHPSFICYVMAINEIYELYY